MQTSSLGTGWSVLGQKKLQVILETLTREQKINNRLLFLNRTPVTPSLTDDDLIADFEGDIYAADIVLDDQQAVVYDAGKFTSFKNEIANVKVGILFGQKQLSELDALRNRGDEFARFASRWIARRQAALLSGVRQRLENLIVSCYRDNTKYDRYGVKVDVSWGTPAQLKLVIDTPWNQHDDATPVSDIQQYLNEIAPDNDALFTENPVLSLSRKAFAHMMACKEFQDKAKVIANVSGLNLNFAFPNGALPNAFDPRMILLASAVVGCTFEFYDATITEKLKDGSVVKSRNLPHNEILVSSPDVWGNRECIDLGNGITTESLVAELIGSGVIGGLPSRSAGPLTYAAPTTIDLNAPGVIMFIVQRCFPRKYNKKSTGLLDIGINPVTGA
jgi:hypothetical protein